MDEFNTLAQALCYLLFKIKKKKEDTLIGSDFVGQLDSSNAFMRKEGGFPVVM